MEGLELWDGLEPVLRDGCPLGGVEGLDSIGREVVVVDGLAEDEERVGVDCLI